ncbi:MAG: hypothetical protein AAB113_02865 [Candidatus Eisenbacteria bacterium]
MDLRSPSRSLGSVAGLVAVLALASVAAAQDRTAASPHHAGLRTGTLLFPAPGVMIATLGVEYMPAVTNDLAGVEGEIVRAPTLGLKLGLADQAMFQVSWPAYNRLRVHAQEEPPPLGRRLGRVSTDWGDLTVATLIRLHAGQGRWPGTGIRFAAKLPNSNEKFGIGDNTTDVFASALFARSIAARVSVFADVGLGILTARTTAFAQNDVFTYSLLADWRVRERLTVVGEVAGRASTHDGGPGTASRSELRAGLELGRRAFHWSALAVHGLSGRDSRGVGVSVNVSSSFTVLERAARAR